eukprot:3104795-Rhodomonas_salina.2
MDSIEWLSSGVCVMEGTEVGYLSYIVLGVRCAVSGTGAGSAGARRFRHAMSGVDMPFIAQNTHTPEPPVRRTLTHTCASANLTHALSHPRLPIFR